MKVGYFLFILWPHVVAGLMGITQLLQFQLLTFFRVMRDNTAYIILSPQKFNSEYLIDSSKFVQVCTCTDSLLAIRLYKNALKCFTPKIN